MGIFTPIFEKRDLRLSDPKAWSPILWNSQSKSGAQVNEYSALHSSTVFRCNKLIADTVASLPLKLYEKDANGGKKELSDRRIAKVLKNPNSEMTHFRFLQTLQGHLFMWGNCFIGVNRDNMNRVLDIWPLSPDKIEITTDERGQIIYLLTTRRAGQIPMTKREILHIPGFGFDGIQGYSIVGLARETIGLSLATEEYGARYFSNGHHPGIILSHPGKLSPEAKTHMQENFAEKYAGLGNVYKALLLEEGMDIKTVSMPHDDAQFLETRQFQNIDFCRFAGVPPHMVFELDRAIYNNIEHQGIEWVRDGIRPWVTLWEQEFSRYFLQPTEYGRIFFEFTIEGLLRGDIKSRYDAYGVAVDKGWMNRNEVRRLENLNPGPAALNEYTVQMQMVSIERAVAEPEPVPPQLEAPQQPQEDEEEENTERAIAYVEDFKKQFHRRAAAARFQVQQSFRSLFRAAAETVVNRETKAIGRAITANFGERGKGEFDSWLNEFYKDMPEYIKAKFRAVMNTYAEQIQKEAAGEVNAKVGMTPALQKFVDEYLDRYSERHISQSILQLRRLMDREEPENIAESLQTRIDEWGEKRADKIADNETVRLNGAITREVFLAAGITRIVWVTMGSKPCPYCLELNGRTVGIESAFVTEGDFQPTGQDPMMIKSPHFHPPLHQGCVCGVTAG